MIQAWDFTAGTNFVQQMDRATKEAKRTVAVLSPDYLSSRFTKSEWQAAFAQDPTSEQSKLLPVRVRACKLEGLLAQIRYIDLVGLAEYRKPMIYCWPRLSRSALNRRYLRFSPVPRSALKPSAQASQGFRQKR